MSTELVLVRHGESHANVKPFIGGRKGDGGLTDRGRVQAQALADRWREEAYRPDALCTSILTRAQETASYLAGAVGLTAVVDEELEELRPGAADGLGVEEWVARWPGLIDGPWLRPFQPFADGGESWASFLVRAGAGLTGLVERHPAQTVVAVTHGGVIEASFALAFGIGPTTTPVGLHPTNTGVTRWRYDPHQGTRRWTLLAYDDATHVPADARADRR